MATPMFDDYPDVVTVQQLQEMLQIGRSTAYKLLASQAVYSKRIGSKYIIPKAAIAAFVTQTELPTVGHGCYNNGDKGELPRKEELQ